MIYYPSYFFPEGTGLHFIWNILLNIKTIGAISTEMCQDLFVQYMPSVKYKQTRSLWSAVVANTSTQQSSQSK